jgi:membrane associated rhomboid family serine protease
LRGGAAGAIVGLVTPILVWPFFLLITSLSEHRFPELFLWSPIYMLISLQRISWFTAILGIALGVTLAYFRRNQKPVIN